MNTTKQHWATSWKNKTGETVGHYASKPYDVNIKIAVSTIEIILCLTGILANLIVFRSLLRKSKTNRKRKRSINSRPSRNVSSTLVFSLIISNLLALLVSYPLLITETFIISFINDLSCKVIRFFNAALPSTINTNLFLIGVERYLSTFYPHKIPTPRYVSILVGTAWFVSGLRGLGWALTVSYQQFNIGSQLSTVRCRIRKDSVFSKVWMATDSTLFAIVQTIVTITLSSRVLWYMRNKQWPKARRKENTKQFSQIILVSSTPYCIALIFIIINKTLLREKINVQMLFILRRCFAVFPTYANTVIIPMMLLKRKPKLNETRIFNNKVTQNKTKEQSPVIFVSAV